MSATRKSPSSKSRAARTKVMIKVLPASKFGAKVPRGITVRWRFPSEAGRVGRPRRRDPAFTLV